MHRSPSPHRSQIHTESARPTTGGNDRIRVRREWIGAPTGTLANPTCWLALFTVVTFMTATAAYLTEGLSAALAIPINTVAIYVAFTVMHESMHGIAHANKTVNTWLGRPMGMLLSISAPMFRAVHYEHHSHTNDPERDPDLFVGKAPVWLLPLWVLGVVVEYRRHYYGRKLWRNRGELAEALGVEALGSALVVGALATGNFAALAVVWIVPALLAVGCLAMAFDYLPHYPYDSRERYHDTRIYPGRAASGVRGDSPTTRCARRAHRLEGRSARRALASRCADTTCVAGISPEPRPCGSSLRYGVKPTAVGG